MIRSRKRIYQKEGMSAKWSNFVKYIEKVIKDRKENYLQDQRDCLLVDDAQRIFFATSRHSRARNAQNNLMSARCSLAAQMMLWRRRWLFSSTDLASNLSR